jgi:hypothetical protein
MGFLGYRHYTVYDPTSYLHRNLAYIRLIHVIF